MVGVGDDEQLAVNDDGGSLTNFTCTHRTGHSTGAAGAGQMRIGPRKTRIGRSNRALGLRALAGEGGGDG